MGCEWLLVDEDKHELFELGKGGWSFVFYDLVHNGILMSLPSVDEMVRLFVDHTFCDTTCDWHEIMIKVRDWYKGRSNIHFMELDQFGDTHEAPKSMIGSKDYWTKGYKITGSRYKDKE